MDLGGIKNQAKVFGFDMARNKRRVHIFVHKKRCPFEGSFHTNGSS